MIAALCKQLPASQILATDAADKKFDFPCTFEKLDVVDAERYHHLVKKHNINYIIHNAGILSSLGEKHPDLSINVNIFGVTNALRAARDNNSRIFIPSSIAVFGGDLFPKRHTPIDTILQPKTNYGIGKVYCEMIGEYFATKFNLDFRSLRFPGIISSELYAFNGTTDYSTEIFFHALEKGHYDCWLGPKQALPMMYIDDCIDATIRFLKADPNKLNRCIFNLAGISFTPEELIDAVEKLIPGFTHSYIPDPRQAIAHNWPKSIDDTDSRI